LDFRILGPLEVLADGQRIHIGSGRQRVLLAMLLLRANKFVGFDDLVDAIWGERGPVHPRAAVHTCVTRLRNALGGVVIEGGTDGYRIVLDEQIVDLYQFESALAAARAAGDREAEVLGQALRLWRGEPLAGVPSDFLQRHEVPRLAEQRLQALERRLELDLAAGGHDAVLPELRALTAEYPLRERFWALLMLALFRCGRQADALTAYATVRQHLVGELGIEPGQELRQAHQQVLAGDQATGWQVECQLPIDVSDFTNRDDELAELVAVLRPGDRVPIMAITGPPGMGKSALVVRAAHRLIGEYPDGQWFLRLNGASPAPRPAMELLAELLRTAGVDPKAIPAGLDARASLLRSRLADRKVLLVLDDAASADQVAPLLPGRPGSGVLVTSRSDLAGLSALYGGTRMPLQPLSPKHAYDLLARIVGPRRCGNEPAASSELAALCGRLPLALRIVAANLASRPALGITQYAADLRTGDRMAKLKTRGESGVAIQATFDISYLALRESDRRAFGLLGLIPGTDFSTAGAAALFGCPVDEATEVLDRLIAANLLECQDADRFRFHDLIRVYAADRVRAENWDKAEAFRRLADWYLHSVHAAVTRCLASLYISRLGQVPPGIVPMTFSTGSAALRWLDAERSNYLAVVEHAAANGAAQYTWQLTDAARPDLHHGFHTVELERSAALGLSCARSAGDSRGEAMMLLALGGLKSITLRFESAVEDLLECRRIAERIGETGIASTAVISLAGTYIEVGQAGPGARAAEEGLELAGRGAEQAEGRVLAALTQFGAACRLLGRLRDSRESLETAARMVRPSTMSELVVRAYLGHACTELGDYDSAMTHYHLVLNSALTGTAVHHECMIWIATIHRETGNPGLALEYATVALDAARKRGRLRYEAEANVVLGSIHYTRGLSAPALKHYQQGRELAARSEAPWVEIEAMIGQALVNDDAELALEAVNRARLRDMRLSEAKALTALAQVRLGEGLMTEARAAAEAALALHRELGSRPGQAQAEAVLSACR
jgi:DNA-binding SARP family transcriptional activator